MGVAEFLRSQFQRKRSKHQVHVRKKKRIRKGRIAVATVNYAGSKLEKYFAKAGKRGPRGY